MTGIDGGTLRGWRRSCNWDVPRLAREIRRAAGDDDPVAVHDALVRMIRRWERTRLTDERYELLYRALGFTGPEPSAGAQPELAGTIDGHPFAGNPLAAPAVRQFADEAAEIGEWAETGTAGDGTVNALADEIERVAREYTTEPPGPLILRASQARKRAFGLMKRRQRLSQLHDLHVVGARACAFMSVGIGDTGDLPVAALHADTAMILAEESRDPSTIALALSAKSKVAFWEKRNGRAASFARRGFELAPHGDPLRVLLACQEADATPVPQAREAIARAGAALDDAGGPPEAGLFSCGTVRLSAYATTLRLREGNYAGVLAAAAEGEMAAANGEDAQFGSMSQLQINTALALLATGDAEQAAARLAPVLGLPAEMRLATFASKLAQAASLAAKLSSDHAARGITEQVRGYLGPDTAMGYPLALGAGK
jgi:hypothetical protein